MTKKLLVWQLATILLATVCVAEVRLAKKDYWIGFSAGSWKTRMSASGASAREITR